jgi:hypothetical protein
MHRDRADKRPLGCDQMVSWTTSAHPGSLARQDAELFQAACSSHWRAAVRTPKAGGRPINQIALPSAVSGVIESWSALCRYSTDRLSADQW